MPITAPQEIYTVAFEYERETITHEGELFTTEREAMDQILEAMNGVKGVLVLRSSMEALMRDVTEDLCKQIIEEQFDGIGEDAPEYIQKGACFAPYIAIAAE